MDAEAYLLACHRYIELNPVRAKMVVHPQEYKWSSYHANGLGKQIKLYTPHEVYLRLGLEKQERERNYRALFQDELNKSDLAAIRYATNAGMVLGSEDFKNQVEALSGRRVRSRRPGPVVERID